MEGIQSTQIPRKCQTKSGERKFRAGLHPGQVSPPLWRKIKNPPQIHAPTSAYFFAVRPWLGASGHKLTLTCSCLVGKSCMTLVTPWTVARQAPLSMGFPRQEYWSGLPFPSPGDLSHPGFELVSPAEDSLPLSHRRRPCSREDASNIRFADLRADMGMAQLSWKQSSAHRAA